MWLLQRGFCFVECVQNGAARRAILRTGNNTISPRNSRRRPRVGGRRAAAGGKVCLRTVPFFLGVSPAAAARRAGK